MESWVDLGGERRAPLAIPPGRAHVLIFLTPTCPIANTYAPEVLRIVKDYADQPVAFFLVHVDPDLTSDDLAEHTRDYGFECPVLFDPEGRLVRATGVTVTPEAAVLTAGLNRAAGPAYDVRYRGRIDDLYTDFGKRRQSPTTRDLRVALDAVLAGQKVEVSRTPAIGCPIPEGS
ncbi:MAG: redoxin domain-containing protein [Planctomycetota bacterium]